VAILQRRLPADWIQERRVLSDLRARAESCKNLLDIAHDYACTLALSYAEVDLRELTARLVAAAAKRFPQLEVQADGDTGCTLVADEGRLSQVGEILIAHACEAARKRVVVQMACDGPSADVKWIVTDDGPPLPEEQ